MPWRQVLALVVSALLSAWVVEVQAAAGDLEAVAVELAKGEDTVGRLHAARRLGASRDPRALEPLVAALGDATRDVRWAAIEALGELGDARAIPALVEYLKRPEAYRWGKRLVAAALGAIGDTAGVDPLLGLLDDEDPFVRRVAAFALVGIGEPRGLDRVATLVKDTADETLGGVRRELARAEEARRRQMAGAAPRAAPAVTTIKPHEWDGVRVGATRLADAKRRFGRPLQDTPDFLLYSGERFAATLRVDSVVLNADARGIVESIFVFPLWGTVDRDVRRLLGPGQGMSYREFLKRTGRTATGAGTRAQGKLHYLPPDTPTEAYGEMGLLVVYDAADAGARDRIVKMIIVH